MAKRGFFAELNHQNQLAARRQAQAERAYAREYAAAVRQAEQAQRQAERAAVQAQRASVAEQKAADREAKRLHVEAQLAEVASLNAQLAAVVEDLDSILSATLHVDDFVDLEQLRVNAEHPPFGRTDLEVPTPPPAQISAPPEPVFVEPEAPKGLGGVFGGKKKHKEATEAAQVAFAATHQAWHVEASAVPGRQLQQMRDRDAAEQQRVAELAQARSDYDRECEAREAAAQEANRQLDELIAGLQAGEDSAIQEYVGIVLGNSVYPEVLSVEHDFIFDSELKELSLTVLVSSPARLPSEKEYKYVKAKDVITWTALPKKDLKERYANAIYQVALRTLHEVFEADREGQINTIALAVATEATDPATGLEKQTALVAVQRSAHRSWPSIWPISSRLPRCSTSVPPYPKAPTT